MQTVGRDEIESGSDLCDAEITAAMKWLRSKEDGKGCASYIQRKMGIGYNHAARIIAYLEACSFISGADDHGERKLIV